MCFFKENHLCDTPTLTLCESFTKVEVYHQVLHTPKRINTIKNNSKWGTVYPRVSITLIKIAVTLKDLH